jgi:hypothetical protein
VDRKEGGSKMKRLSIAALLLIALTTGAVAHEGSIGMYTDLSGTDCDMNFTPFVGASISILYFKSDSGPNGIFSAQFKVESMTATLSIQEFVKSPEVSVTLGNVGTGISCSFSNCAGAGSDYLLIGTLSVVTFMDEPQMLRIATAEDIVPENPPVAVRVTICDVDRTKQAVLGGYFTSPNNTCSTGTKEKSWGAIKEMYKD